MVARIQARDDDPVALFVDEGCGKTLVATSAGTLEWIETDRMDRLNTLSQAPFDASKVGFHLGTECLQFIKVARDVGKGITDIMGIKSYDEAAHLDVHPNDKSKQYQRGESQNNETENEGVGEQ